MLLLYPALLWSYLCPLGRYLWECLPSLDSFPVDGQGRELTGHGKKFITPPCNAIVVHTYHPRYYARVSRSTSIAGLYWGKMINGFVLEEFPLGGFVSALRAPTSDHLPQSIVSELRQGQGLNGQ